MYKFSQDDANVSVWLVIDNKEYSLSQFNISFRQTTDHKGEPQCMVRGGEMHLLITEILPESIYEWALKSNIKNMAK